MTTMRLGIFESESAPVELTTYFSSVASPVAAGREFGSEPVAMMMFLAFTTSVPSSPAQVTSLLPVITPAPHTQRARAKQTSVFEPRAPDLQNFAQQEFCFAGARVKFCPPKILRRAQTQNSAQWKFCAARESNILRVEKLGPTQTKKTQTVETSRRKIMQLFAQRKFC